MSEINSIFIIDDDAITVFGVKKMIHSTVSDSNIKTFKNGQLAIEGMTQLLEQKEQIPELIFLDINMPIMDGWQFLKEFIALPIQKKVHVSIITSSIDQFDKKKWMTYSAETHHHISYNHKPLTKEKITEITQFTTT